MRCAGLIRHFLAFFDDLNPSNRHVSRSIFEKEKRMRRVAIEQQGVRHHVAVSESTAVSPISFGPVVSQSRLLSSLYLRLPMLA